VFESSTELALAPAPVRNVFTGKGKYAKRDSVHDKRFGLVWQQLTDIQNKKMARGAALKVRTAEGLKLNVIEVALVPGAEWERNHNPIPHPLIKFNSP
jgi:hypothetical protein